MNSYDVFDLIVEFAPERLRKYIPNSYCDCVDEENVSIFIEGIGNDEDIDVLRYSELCREIGSEITNPHSFFIFIDYSTTHNSFHFSMGANVSPNNEEAGLRLFRDDEDSYTVSELHSDLKDINTKLSIFLN